jgi:AraC-like DNA-binding protein
VNILRPAVKFGRGTLGEALSDFVNFQISNSTGAAVYLHRLDGDFALGYGIYDPGTKVSHQIYDLILAAGLNIIHELTAGAVEPLEILAIRQTPKDVAPYAALANCPFRFNQPQTCLILSGRSMNFKLKTADREAREEILTDLHRRLMQAPWGAAGRVRHALRSLLLASNASLQDMADHQYLHPRSLRRCLRSEGTSFGAIKDEIRYTLARELLALTQLAVADIALSLDYSTPSSFIHAFQRWSGMSPTQWRQQLQAEIS